MQINVETKFNIGQEVYIIQKARSKEPCAACNGEGHIIIDGNRFSCIAMNEVPGNGSKVLRKNVKYQKLYSMANDKFR